MHSIYFTWTEVRCSLYVQMVILCSLYRCTLYSVLFVEILINTLSICNKGGGVCKSHEISPRSVQATPEVPEEGPCHVLRKKDDEESGG